MTKATLEHLGDKFEVEPGFGSSREQYLADHKIETYLIIPPKVRLQMMNYYIHETNTNDHIYKTIIMYNKVMSINSYLLSSTPWIQRKGLFSMWQKLMTKDN